jgi:hypothetical protein
VDAVLPVARSVEESQRQPRLPPAPAEHVDRYLAGALRRAAHVVATAAEGRRNNTLNRETHSLARLPELAHDVIERAMCDAACAAGLPAWEAKRTISSALRARRRGAA